MFDDVLIMAGGSGTRLWPASSSRLPKQFLPAEKDKSFFTMAAERALSVINKDGRVIIITGKQHIQHVLNSTSKLSREDKKRLLVIGEPIAKNTAPAAACAVMLSLGTKTKKKGGAQDRNMLILTSDHIIKPLKTFKKDASLAVKSLRKHKDSLIIFGIPPSCPNTGYGYIETYKSSKQKDNIYSVTAFHEKPDAKTAVKYAKDRRFFWNSGMFAFNTGFMKEEMRKNAYEVFLPFELSMHPGSGDFSVSKGIKILKNCLELSVAYKTTKNISFDYAIAEKCKKIFMIKASFDWVDIGDWDEYARFQNENDRTNNPQVFFVPENEKSKNTCFIDSDIPVALAGAENLIVVIRSGKNGQPASALIIKKGQSQKVREIVENIKKSGKNDLL